ncbi:MAG: FAD binding domain-containing protein, partial [Candidatus Izemoplasmatales bacterium]|nr:FAD binding domain-containing protein [Candidatus Izemoplasmatales bacterium]
MIEDMEIKEYIAPKTISEAYSLLSESRSNKIIAGGAWTKISFKRVDKLISLDNLALDYIKENNDNYVIGAMTTLRAIETHEGLKHLASGILSQAIGSVMGINIRNIATIGGSIMGKFAFSDLLGVLLVMDAKLMFFKAGEVSIYDFVEMTKIPEDILLEIKLKKDNFKGYFKKVSKTHLDFAILNIAITKKDNFKITVGSRPNIAKLAIDTANYLNSQKT